MSQNRLQTQYQWQRRPYQGKFIDHNRSHTQHIPSKSDQVNNFDRGLKGFTKEIPLLLKNEETGMSKIFKSAYKINKKWFFIKYILLFFFFIAYGSILVSLHRNGSQSKSIKIEKLSVAGYGYNFEVNNSSGQEVKMIKTKINKNVEKTIKKQNQMNQNAKSLKAQKTNASIIVETKIQRNRQIQIETEKRIKQLIQIDPFDLKTQMIKDDQSLNLNHTQQISVGSYEKVENIHQKSSYYPQQQSTQNFPIAISRTEQSMVRDIIQTYQDNYKKVTRAERELPFKNSQAINSIKQQIQEKQKEREEKKIKRTYDSFEDKIDQTSGKGRTIQFHLGLFPFLRPWATTPMPTTKFQRFASTFKGLFVSQTYLWDDLYEMLDTGGYWESNGNLLTVATYSKVIDDQYGSLQIFTPTIITLWFPHDIPSNEVITFTGIRMRYDLHTNVETKWVSEYIGELRVKPTLQERKKQEPIERIFYCELQGCNYLYSLVQLKSNNNIRLHFMQIDSIFSVGR